MKISSILYLCLIVFCNGFVFAQDTISQKGKDIHENEYKIRPSVSIDLFNTKTVGLIAKRKALKEVDYSFREFSFSFYTPIISKTSKKIGEDKQYKSNFTLLATGSYVRSRPQFSFFNATHNFIRISAGLRGLYFDGNKSLWLVNVSPFIAEDNKSISNAKFRMFGDLIYSRVVSKMFSYKLGLSYTYRFGGGGLLPVVGVRIGDYNKYFLSVQFPKNISFHYKVNPKLYIGAFVRPNGGIYRYKIQNTDPAFFNDKSENSNIILTRTDYLTGLMLNYAITPSVYFTCNSGVVYNRSVDLSINNTFNGTGGKTVFKGSGRTLNIENSVFFNVGFTFYFGKPLYSSGFSPLLEMKAVNNTTDSGDLNNSNDGITNDQNQVELKDINKKEAKTSLEDNYNDIQEYLVED